MNALFRKHVRKHERRKLMTAILSLSLLTVMAGAAVAPALDLILAYFQDTDPVLIQMIISIPALFIFLTNLFFQRLCRRFRAKQLVLAGLLMYVVFGSIAGVFSNIWLILLCRALVGVGVGILMPMSTGLISFYFAGEEQERLMGYASAMNMMGGVVAMIVVGLLITVSWRLSFLVYLSGAASMLLVWKWMPNEYIAEQRDHGQNNVKPEPEIIAPADHNRESTFREYYPFIIAMFLLMTTFFIYPANFAVEMAKDGVIHRNWTAFIMAGMDILGFIGGLCFVRVRKSFGRWTKIVAPLIFMAGYMLMEFLPSAGAALCLVGTVIGSMAVGFANGVGVPFLMTAASEKAGKEAPVKVMPALSMALYLAQFLTPFVIVLMKKAGAAAGNSLSSYGAAIVISVILTVWSWAAIRE